MSNPKCSARVFQDFRYYGCERSAKVDRDGKGYCKQHDPVYIAEKQRAREQAWDLKFADQAKAADRKRAERECCEAMLGDNFQLAIDLARYALGRSDVRPERNKP